MANRLLPSLLVGLHSRSDRPAELEARMTAYGANGVRLGWLIAPYARKVRFTGRGGAVAVGGRASHRGDPELAGLVLGPAALWEWLAGGSPLRPPAPKTSGWAPPPPPRRYLTRDSGGLHCGVM